MPGIFPKQVRFAYQNLFHSPPTPALSFSGSSISSDAGPATPPFPTYTLPVPYSAAPPTVKPIRRACPYLRLQPSSLSAVIHTQSLLSVIRSTYSGTNDMGHDGSPKRSKAITTRLSPEVCFRNRLHSPPISILTISSPHLPWTIKVYASTDRSSHSRMSLAPFTTPYAKNITSQEFNSIPTSDDRRRATRA